MKERPITVSAPLVKAVLNEDKTQTRLPLQPQPDNPNCWPTRIWGSGVPRCDPDHFCVHAPTNVDGDRVDVWIPCPYGKAGDRLWLRETYAPINTTQPLSRYTLPCNRRRVLFEFAADHTPDFRPKQSGSGYELKWRSPQAMPRWASRILLEIVSIRCERLQDISGKDATAEGISIIHCYGPGCPDGPDGCNARGCFGAREQYQWLWEKIHGPGSWAANPFVWCITFRRIDNAVA